MKIDKNKLRSEAKSTLSDLITKEVIYANNVYVPFNSPYEGYAVLKEELEEVTDWTDSLILNADLLWSYVKIGETEKSVMTAMKIKELCLCASEELIQVAAVAQKYIDNFEKLKSHKKK